MSQTIDSKVVEMKFDNSQFEGNVRNSINTLGDLKNALNMDNVSDSLSGITKAAQSVDVSSVGEGVDELQIHFSALDVMATTILANITNSAVNAGKTIVSAITGAFAQGGWQRASNIEQAEFRLEGLGMDVEEVMANANEAVKGTAFGLDEAAKAASVFGASGIEAGEDMTSTLRAVAGVAAMTGDSYDSIANIFESVAGNGKLMTYTMRQLETRGLNVAATLGDVLGYTETEIREMVSNGEIDFKTFSDAMDEAFGEHAQDANKTFSGALANMKTALSRFGADVCTPLRDNLRDVFNGITPVIDNIHEAAAPAINGLSDLFEALASKVLDFFNIFDGTGTSSFFEFIGNGIEKLANAINNFDVSNFVSKFKMTDDTINNLKSTFQGLISFLDLVRQAFGFVISVVGELLTFLAPVGSAILNVTGKFGDWITKIDQMAKENEVFATASEKVIGALEKVKSGFKNFREAVAEKFDLSSFDGLGTAFDNLKEKMSPVTTALKNFKETVGSACKSAWASVKENFSPIIDKFKEFGNNIKETFQNFKSNGNGDFMSFLGTLGSVFTNGLASIIEGVGTGISKFIEALGKFDFSGITGLLSSIGLSEIWINLGQISNSFKNLFSGLTSGGGDKGNSILLELKNILTQYQREIRAATLIMIAAAIGILAGALVEISNIEDGKLASSLAGIGALIGELIGACALINKINFTASLKSMSSLVILSRAIKNLASSCVELGQLDWGGIARGLTGIGGLFAELYAFMYGLQKLSFKNVNVFAISIDLIVLAEAIKMLSKSVETFGSMSWNDLAAGLTGVGGLLAELYAFLAGASSLTKSKGSYNMIGLASSIVILAAGIKILQSAVTELSGLSWGELAKGLVGITALVTEVIVFLEVVSRLEKTENSYNLIGIASSIVILATGIKILQSAVTKLSDLSWNELAKGLSGVGGLLLELGVFLKAVSSLTKGEGGYNLIGVASSIVILASGIKILQSAVMKFSSMSWEEMAKGLLTLAGVLTEVVLAFKFIETDGILKTASAMLVLSTACLIFAPAMKILGSLSWESIAKGLITIAGAFTIIGVAGWALSGLSGPILALSAALLVIGIAADALAVALVVAGAGLVTISAGLTSFATAMAVSGSEIVAGISAIILGVIALVPEIINGFINGVMSVWDTITNFIIDIVHMLIEVIKSTVPELVDGILEVILEVCQSLAEYAPQIVDALMVLVEGVVDALVEKMPEIISKIKELVNEIFNGIFENMDTKGLLELVTSIGLISLVIAGISKLKINLASAAKTVAELGILIAELAGVLALVGQMTRIPGLEDGIDRAADLLEGLGNAIGGLVGGLVGGIMTGITGSLPQVASDLSEFMDALQPFLDGCSNISPDAGAGIQSFANALLTITEAKFIDRLASFGSIFTGKSYSYAEMGEQLAELTDFVNVYAENVSGLSGEGSTIEADTEVFLGILEGITSINLPNDKPGLWGLLSGWSSYDYGDLSDQIGELTGFLETYQSEVSGLSAEGSTIEADTEVFVSIINAITSIETPKDKPGLWDLITGWSSYDYGALSDQIGELTGFLGNYEEAISGLSASGSTIESDTDTLVYILDAITSIEPPENKPGLWDLITGWSSYDYGDLSDQILELTGFLDDYADAISGLSGEGSTVEADTEVFVKVLDAVTSIEPPKNKPGLWDLITGWSSYDYSSLSDQVAELTGFIDDYADAISGLSDEGSTVEADTEVFVKVLDAVTSVEPPNDHPGLLDLITGWSSYDYGDLSNQITELTGFIDDYADAISGLSDEGSTVEADTEVFVKILDAVTSIVPPQDKPGLWDLITGWSSYDYGSLSDQVGELTGFLDDYGEAISGLSENATIEADTDIFVKILDAVTSVEPPNDHPGLWDLITGWSSYDYSTLSSQVADLTGFLGDYSDAISGLSDEGSTVEADTEVFVEILNAVTSIVPPQDKPGLLDLITGWSSYDYSSLSSQVSDLTGFLGDYEDAISGLSSNGSTIEADTEAFVSILNSLLSINIEVGDAGFLGWLEGTTLGQFGNQLTKFAEAVKEYSEEAAGINTGAIEESQTAISYVVSIGNRLSNIDDIQAAGQFGDNLVAFGEDLEQFCGMTFDASTISSSVDAINELAECLGGFGSTDFSAANNFVSSMTSIAQNGLSAFEQTFITGQTQVTNAAETAMQVFCDGMTSKQTDVVSTINTIIDAMLEAISSKNSEFNSSGQTLMTELISGIKSNSDGVSSACTSAVSSAASAIRGYYSDFYSAGAYLCTGIANGISANTYQVTAKASAMASAAKTAAAAALDENSPSKEGFKIGDFFGIGFINGIANNIGKSFDIGQELAENSITGLSSAVSKINEFIDGGMDVSPVITPVLDLSNVKAGMDSMNGMFAQSRTLAFAADNASFIADSMNRRNIQNDPMGDVLRAIKDLNRHMTNLSGDTYNVNGVTYDDGSNVADAVGTLVHAAKIGRRA